MSDETEETDDAPPAKGKKGLVVIVLLAVLAGGGAFGAVWMGLLDPILDGTETAAETEDGTESVTVAEVAASVDAQSSAGAAFHPLEPLSVSIADGGESRQLRIRVVLEVPAASLASVVEIEPRLLDGILGYLRAIDHETIEDPAALLHLRGQMLRRARLIAGQDAVDNLLVTDFVLN